VMAEPGVGAYGVAAVAGVLVLRWAALASMRPSALLVAGLWCLSRTAMAVTLTRVRYVGGGLASAFSGGPAAPVAAGGVVLAVALIALGRGIAGIVALAGAALAAALVVAFGRRRIGGFTGDVLGAAGVIAETVGLVVAAAKW
jgi:adenosylcobinamide-GDP ribazoletransferase